MEQEKQNKKRKISGILTNVAFIHEQSCECAKTELDVFSVPRLRPASNAVFVEYHSLSSITDTDPIEFDVSSS